jgi:MoaA/NifB/PqqE/SkfB family radical SAM enzyme
MKAKVQCPFCGWDGVKLQKEQGKTNNPAIYWPWWKTIMALIVFPLGLLLAIWGGKPLARVGMVIAVIIGVFKRPGKKAWTPKVAQVPKKYECLRCKRIFEKKD